MLKASGVNLKDFKKACELWTREELLESLYILTKELERVNAENYLYEENKRYLTKQIAKLKMRLEKYEDQSDISG